MVPILETERLTLRGPTPADLPDMIAMWEDLEVTRHIGGKPQTPDETWSRLLRYVGHWQLLGFGPWIVRDKAGAFVGEAALFDLHRDITPALELPELGYALAASAHGRGYATEATRAVLAWGSAHFGHDRASCIIDPGNAASLRVAAKLGFRERARTTYKGTPTIVFTR